MVNFASIVAENRAKILASRFEKLDTFKTEVKLKDLQTTDLYQIEWIWDETISKLLGLGIMNIEQLSKKWALKIKALKLNPFSENAIIDYINNIKK